MASDRTEQPTSRRVRDARRKGQIARSKDLAETAQMLAILIVLGWTGRTYVGGLGQAVQRGLSSMSGGTGATIEPGVLTQLALNGAGTLALLVGPLALASVVASVGTFTAQGGWNIATEAIGIHWDRLNPVSGVKRLYGRVGLDLVKMLLAVSVIGWLAWRVVDATIAQADVMGRVAPLRAAEIGWAQAERLLRQTTVVLAILAGGDYLLQRWRLQKSLRMTKQEVRDDMRLIEGNPEIKARVRRLQREMARRRMLAAVPKATVVITNPTEYAVALEYSRQGMPAPRVLAKGRGFLAARIKAIARDHGVPIVENVPLAQSLYRGVEVGGFIPAELFGAVAEVLAYLIRLEQLVL